MTGNAKNTAVSGPQSQLKIVIMVFAIVLIVVSVCFMWYRQQQSPLPLQPVSKVTLAMPTQISSALLIVASAQDLYRKNGVEVVEQHFLLGKDALKAVIDDKADVAVVADVPYVYAVLGGHDVSIISAVSQARRAMALVTRNDRGIQNISDLFGKSIGVTKGTNLMYFLDAMLQVNRLNSESVNKVDLTVDEGVAAFKSGKLDALVVFQPYLAQLEADMGHDISVFYGEDVYAFRFLLVGKPTYIDHHHEEIQRLLKALIDAKQYIHDKPMIARKSVGEVVKVNDKMMEKLFTPDDYIVTLDQAMLLALDDQSRWAMQHGLAKKGPVPNYLNFMKYGMLESVMPNAVKIVR